LGSWQCRGILRGDRPNVRVPPTGARYAHGRPEAPTQLCLMTNTRPVRRSLSIEELTAEMREPSVRQSLGGGVLPKDPDWWFPKYVPAWARMLPRELYAAVFNISSAKWQVEGVWRRSKRGRKPGRPRHNTPEEDLRYFFEVEGKRRLLASSGKRGTVVATLQAMYKKKNVGAERGRYIRARKLYKNTQIRTLLSTAPV
jgi:hypothetical protein